MRRRREEVERWMDGVGSRMDGVYKRSCSGERRSRLL